MKPLCPPKPELLTAELALDPSWTMAVNPSHHSLGDPRLPASIPAMLPAGRHATGIL